MKTKITKQISIQWAPYDDADEPISHNVLIDGDEVTVTEIMADQTRVNVTIPADLWNLIVGVIEEEYVKGGKL